MTRCSL